jgi:KH domain
VQVPEHKIGLLIGTGGCIVKEIQQRTHSSITLSKAARKAHGMKEVRVAAMTPEALTAACDLVEKVRMHNRALLYLSPHDNFCASYCSVHRPLTMLNLIAQSANR